MRVELVNAYVAGSIQTSSVRAVEGLHRNRALLTSSQATHHTEVGEVVQAW